MSIAAVRTALETRLAAMTPKLDTAWENKTFAPKVDEPYQRATLLPAEPENPTYGDNFYREQGILHVNLCYPITKGAGEASARAELLRDNFYRGLSLVSNGVTVIIERTPEIAPALVDGELYVIPVSIRYFANIN